jgi:hypothetical protein
MMKTLNLRLVTASYLAGILLIHAAVFWNVRHMVREGYSDFTIYYCAGTIVRQGLGRQLYDSGTQFRIQQEFAGDVSVRQGPLPYNHPPFEALLFLPFTYFSYPKAFVLWDLVNLAMLAALPFLLRPHLPQLRDYSWVLWMLAILAFAPVFVTLLQGQDAILLLFLYTLAYVCFKKNNDAGAGVCLALGLFKFHLVLPFVVLFLLQRRKLLYGFLPAAGVLGLISLLTVGMGAIISYPRYVLFLERHRDLSAIVPSEMPNLRGILYLLLGPNPHLGAAVLMVSVGIFLIAAWRGRGKETSDVLDWQFSLAALATVLVSYHTLAHDLSILLLPMFLITNQLLTRGKRRHWRGLVIGSMAVLCFSPLQLLLLLRFGRFAFVGWAVLLCMFGIAAQIPRNRAAYPRSVTA